MRKISRRTAIKVCIIGGIAASAKLSGATDYLPNLLPTPPEIKGSFYPIVVQKDKDFDLTRVKGRPTSAKGDVIFVEGHVVDTTGKPISDATVELWQASSSGKYNHPHDPNPAPADPNFQGWAIVRSGEKGAIRFKTVMPGAYPSSANWMRPPHIHFKVTKRGYIELITQMYFPGHSLNEKDLLLLRKSKEERELMIAKAAENTTKFRYRIVLQKV